MHLAFPVLSTYILGWPANSVHMKRNVVARIGVSRGDFEARAGEEIANVLEGAKRFPFAAVCPEIMRRDAYV